MKFGCLLIAPDRPLVVANAVFFGNSRGNSISSTQFIRVGGSNGVRIVMPVAVAAEFVG